MSIRDTKSVISLYERRLKKYGVSVKTMGWRNKKQQDLRFKVLSEIGSLSNKKILDIGCGFGDFYDYLISHDMSIKYSGYDIAPKIIEAAKIKHPNLKLEVKDILKDEIREKFDYVFESGIFNKRVKNNICYAKKIIKKMFSLCKVAIGFNMTTDYVDYKERRLFYYSPYEIFKFAKSLSRFAVLRHDYPLYEFTAYIYKICPND
ncbi:methyltransferase domain-containing protein [Candidatus Omnitrophota bacterium]